MGMWKDDVWNGNGAIITIDGQYFEGNFAHNKITVSRFVLIHLK